MAYFDVPIMRYHYGEYYNVFAEHLNYWTVNSFSKLVDSCHFEIIRVEEVLDGNHIAALVRKPQKELSFRRREMAERQMLNTICDSGKKVGIYGAGIKGRIFAKSISQGIRNVIHFFDGDSQLEGLYVQNFNLPIEKPTIEKMKECDVLILTAIQYRKEIIQMLRERYEYSGEIRCIGDTL